MKHEDDTGGDIGGNKPLSRAEHDRMDLGHESAGLEVGRIHRFLPDSARPDPTGKRAGREERALSALMTLLQNPSYAALYNETLDQLRRAEDAAASALAKATDLMDQADSTLEKARIGASTLRDGTRVYRDADGNARTEDGRVIGGHERDQITWRAGAVSYEEFLAHRKAAEDARRAVDDVRRYQVDVLGRARDRLENEDHPPSEKELGEIQEEIKAAPPLVASETPEPTDSPPDGAFYDFSGAKQPPIGN